MATLQQYSYHPIFIRTQWSSSKYMQYQFHYTFYQLWLLQIHAAFSQGQSEIGMIYL